MDEIAKWTKTFRDLTPAEQDARLNEVFRFCTLHDTDPAALVRDWEKYPELNARRRLPAEEAARAANRVVESFLIANGINVFGEIVCMTTLPEYLGEQGAKFVPLSLRA